MKYPPHKMLIDTIAGIYETTSAELFSKMEIQSSSEAGPSPVSEFTILTGDVLPPERYVNLYRQTKTRHFLTTPENSLLRDLVLSSLMTKRTSAFCRNPLPALFWSLSNETSNLEALTFGNLRESGKEATLAEVLPSLKKLKDARQLDQIIYNFCDDLLTLAYSRALQPRVLESTELWLAFNGDQAFVGLSYDAAFNFGLEKILAALMGADLGGFDLVKFAAYATDLIVVETSLRGLLGACLPLGRQQHKNYHLLLS